MDGRRIRTPALNLVSPRLQAELKSVGAAGFSHRQLRLVGVSFILFVISLS
jgi:hypothetical protein